MISRRSLLGASALLPLTQSVWAAPSYTPGKEYLLVNPQVQSDPSKIEVTLFFAYTCPHCLQYEPLFDEWAKTAPADVIVNRCPVAWQPKYFPFTETYFSLEALGLLDKLSMPFFESVIYQTHSYDFNNAADDIQDFMSKNGVDAAKWKATVNSFGVKNKNRVAFQLWQAYQIDSTPMVGVAGQYTSGPHLVGSRAGMAGLLNHLVDKVRKERHA